MAVQAIPFPDLDNKNPFDWGTSWPPGSKTLQPRWLTMRRSRSKATRRSPASMKMRRRRCGGSSISCIPIRPPFRVIVLVLGVILFTVIAGGKFLHPFNLSLILQQVTIIGIRGDRPDPHRPDGRHRPVGRRHHGSLVRRDGKVRHAARPAAADRFCVRPAGRRGLRRHQRLPGHAAAPAALHRHAGHLEHLFRAQSLVLRQRDDPLPGYRGDRAVPAVDRHLI